MSRSGLARALLAAVMAIPLLAGPGTADTLDDLLFDLQLVPLDRRPAPDFTLGGLDGKPLSLAELKDRVVFLYFWAGW